MEKKWVVAVCVIRRFGSFLTNKCSTTIFFISFLLVSRNGGDGSGFYYKLFFFFLGATSDERIIGTW